MFFRRVPFSAIPNARDVGGYPTKDGKVMKTGQFYRSGIPFAVSADDEKLFERLNVKNVVDLRNEEERLREVDATQFVKGLRRVVFETGGQMPLCKQEVPPLYVELMKLPNKRDLFAFFAECQGAVLFHCTAGKDRTGTVAAILQMLAGVDDADIVADYVVTYAYFYPRIRQFIARNPQMDPEVGIPEPEHMFDFLKLFREEFGSAENYLAQIGLTAEQIAKLKSKVV